jgi:hypothetical protein
MNYEDDTLGTAFWKGLRKCMLYKSSSPCFYLTDPPPASTGIQSNPTPQKEYKKSLTGI